ncbi:MAG TPA: YcxB family protein [Gammaproteobacteria bacterium]
MEIEITLEKEDWRRYQSYIEKQLWGQQKNWKEALWVNIVVWALMAALLMMLFHNFSEVHWPTGLFVFVIFALIAVIYFHKAHKLRKAYEPMESGVFCGKHKFVFTDEEIISEGEGYQGRHAWKIVKRVERGNGIILIFLDTIHAYVFPEGKLDSPDEFYEYVLWRLRLAEGADRQVAA